MRGNEHYLHCSAHSHVFSSLLVIISHQWRVIWRGTVPRATAGISCWPRVRLFLFFSVLLTSNCVPKLADVLVYHCPACCGDTQDNQIKQMWGYLWILPIEKLSITTCMFFLLIYLFIYSLSVCFILFLNKVAVPRSNCDTVLFHPLPTRSIAGVKLFIVCQYSVGASVSWTIHTIQEKIGFTIFFLVSTFLNHIYTSA